MQIKDHVSVKIDSIAFGGEGVGRIDNFVVFVPFSAPGDELEIEITRQKKKFVRGKILGIIEQSSLRTEPLCRYYRKCGGCCYQHLDYKYQLIIKEKQVRDAFWKIGKIKDPPLLPIIASPKIYHYRGKAQLHAENNSMSTAMGFLDVSGSRVVDIENCEIMEESINEKMRILRESKRPEYDENELTIWSENLRGRLNEKDSVIRTVKGQNFLIPRNGFFQANLYLTDRLVDEVCRLANAGKMKTIIDAYCGSGLFSVFLSSYAEKVIGIEIDEKSVAYARINSGQTGVKNTSFIQGNVDSVFRDKFVRSGEKIDLMVIDPPRSGCKNKTLKAMIDMQPQRVIYISCNPATQARDIKYLHENGYDLKSLLPLDMFPQTEHIEVVGFMVRR